MEGAAGGNPLSMLLPFVLIFAVFYFIVIMPAKKQQKKKDAMLAALKKGDRIVTNGGIHGTVATVEDQYPACQSGRKYKNSNQHIGGGRPRGQRRNRERRLTGGGESGKKGIVASHRDRGCCSGCPVVALAARGENPLGARPRGRSSSGASGPDRRRHQGRVGRRRSATGEFCGRRGRGPRRHRGGCRGVPFLGGGAVGYRPRGPG